MARRAVESQSDTKKARPRHPPFLLLRGGRQFRGKAGEEGRGRGEGAMAERLEYRSDPQRSGRVDILTHTQTTAAVALGTADRDTLRQLKPDSERN